MDSLEIATMSSRGQIVIPQGIRDSLGLDAGAKFVVLGDEDTIIFKKLEVPSKNEFKALLKETRKIAKKSKVKRSDVKKAIRSARKKS
jgi:AbrB family looped-hinge helix DNA binding protein